MIEKEELELQIKAIEQELKSNASEYYRLQKNPKVERYLELDRIISDLSTKKHHLRIAQQQLKYEECTHPLWYFLKSSHDFTKGDINWTCQCLNCGQVQTDKNYFFWNKVILQSILLGHGRKSQHSYNTVAKAYQEASRDEPIKQVNKKLVKQYSAK